MQWYLVLLMVGVTIRSLVFVNIFYLIIRNHVVYILILFEEVSKPKILS